MTHRTYADMYSTSSVVESWAREEQSSHGDAAAEGTGAVGSAAAEVGSERGSCGCICNPMMMRWQTLTLESSASHAREWYSSARAPSAIRAQYTRAKNAAAIAGRKTNEMMRVLGTNRAKHTCGVWVVGGRRRGSGAELAHKIACWVRRWRFACPWRITPWLADGIRVRAHVLNSKKGEEDLVEHVRVPKELDALGRLEPRV